MSAATFSFYEVSPRREGSGSVPVCLACAVEADDYDFAVVPRTWKVEDAGGEELCCEVCGALIVEGEDEP